jgi:hypothetical protein
MSTAALLLALIGQTIAGCAMGYALAQRSAARRASRAWSYAADVAETGLVSRPGYAAAIGVGVAIATGETLPPIATASAYAATGVPTPDPVTR